MKSWILSLFMVAGITISSHSEEMLSVEVNKTTAITGLSAPKIAGRYVLLDAGSKPVIAEVAVITVSTQAKFVQVKARKTLFEFSPVDKVGDKQFVVAGVGRHAIEITTFDPESGIESKIVEVTLNESVPQPDPTPDPVNPPGPVPSDPFDNIGQRVAKWSVGLPKKTEVSKVYTTHASQLRSDPLATINVVSASLTNGLQGILGAEKALYNSCNEQINADLKSRWPMSRGTYADYLDAISRGYK